MKHCEDCIHDEVCGMWAVDSGIPFVNADTCVHYKAKNGVVLLPRNAGDWVYRLNRVVWDDECCHCDHYRVGGFGDPSECGRTEDGRKHPDCIKITEEVLTQDEINHYLRTHAFGEYIFHSRAEAEQALKDMQRGDIDA